MYLVNDIMKSFIFSFHHSGKQSILIIVLIKMAWLYAVKNKFEFGCNWGVLNPEKIVNN